jgi:hypothetical protein
MSAVLERDGAYVRKFSPFLSTDGVGALVSLTSHLRLHGLPVPEMTQDSDMQVIRWPWIDGTSMKEVIEAKAAKHLMDFSAEIECAMIMAARIHAIQPPASLMVRYNPFRLIDKRMISSFFALLPQRHTIVALVEHLRSVIPQDNEAALIHGDFHVGQLIRQRGSGTWWVIDFDDTCIGHREADIANFCAHLATSAQLISGDPLELINALWKVAVSRYDLPLDASRFSLYASAALVRRALKILEQGKSSDLADDYLHAAITLSLGPMPN